MPQRNGWFARNCGLLGIERVTRRTLVAAAASLPFSSTCSLMY